MGYENYKLEDFLTDLEFKRWVLHPDEHTHFFWSKWMAAHPEQKSTILRARELILSYQFRQPEVIADEERDQILENILGRGEKQSNVRRKPVVFLRYAATIGLALLLSIFLYSKFSAENREEIIATVIKENPAGQKSVIRLPDGTKVWLNSESRIEYPEKFVKVRNVVLHGEAFFEVVKNINKPFKVRSNGVTTTALGTSFNIRAYSEEKEVEVVLITGAVAVKAPDIKRRQPQEIIIKPGEKVVYDRENQKATKAVNTDKTVTSWKEGILSFRKAGMAEIKHELERWYGVQIEIEGLDRQLYYTGDFDNSSLERVLERLAFTEQFTFEIEEDNVKINFKN